MWSELGTPRGGWWREQGKERRQKEVRKGGKLFLGGKNICVYEMDQIVTVQAYS